MREASTRGSEYEQRSPHYDAIILRLVLFVIGLHAMVLFAMLGLLFGRAWIAHVVPLMLGVTVVSIGNLFPRIRPNRAIGIRTERILSDRALWMRTHRSMGYLVVACGSAIVLSAIAVPVPIGPAMILLIAPAAFVATCLLIWSSARHAHA